MSIRFGPAGLGGVKEAEKNLEHYSQLGLKACEIAFTYGVYIKNKEDAVRIGKKAQELGIKLSIHAPYWLNLNSKEKRKIEESKKRILQCCEIGDFLGAEIVVFHPGYYGKDQGFSNPIIKEETYQNIKKAILEIQEEIARKKYKIRLAPETTGKLNVFGSIDEIKRLVQETGCSFCIDFAHILARYKDYKFDLIKKSFPQEKWHCHFSGIEYGEKGEKSHKATSESELKKLLSVFPRNKNIVLINESPEPVKDSVKALNILKSEK